jgi:hypothetical protein
MTNRRSIARSTAGTLALESSFGRASSSVRESRATARTRAVVHASRVRRHRRATRADHRDDARANLANWRPTSRDLVTLTRPASQTRALAPVAVPRALVRERTRSGRVPARDSSPSTRARDARGCARSSGRRSVDARDVVVSTRARLVVAIGARTRSSSPREFVTDARARARLVVVVGHGDATSGSKRVERGGGRVGDARVAVGVRRLHA